MRISILIVAVAVVVALAGCDSIADSGVSAGATAEPTVPAEVYDEAERTPIAELPDQLTQTIADQGGDIDANACVSEAVLAGFNDGVLSPFDLDAYVRLSTVTDPMQRFLQDLQAAGTCQPV